MSAQKKRVLFLYTELAPYFLACLKALVTEHGVSVSLVRWPVNKEAPFALEFAEGITVYERDSLDRSSLLELYENLAPDIVLASGWVDKDYLAVCKRAMHDSKPSVMCSDTAWRGGAKQWAAVVASKLWIGKTFSHAWVSGNMQAEYAAKLGFAQERINTGFYSADVPAFTDLSEQFAVSKAKELPHRFLCIARYIPSKGHQYLCEAFAELCDAGKMRDWELWFVGTGELYPLSFQHERIIHKGFTQPADLAEIQKACSIFILPSTYEPWGVVVQEHALAGFPLLLSNAVGARERFLRDGQNGYVFEAGNKTSLQDRILAFVNADDELIHAMSGESVALGRDWDPSKWANLLLKQMIP